MSEECSKNCDTCGSVCGDKKETKSMQEAPHELSDIKKVIAVVSGKGGVGKSLVTAMMSVLAQRKGYQAAILDADITGPSMPKAFGVSQKAMGNDKGIYPVNTKTGIEMMSINLLLENDTDPVIWRGSVISNTVKQFWTDVMWKDVDYMFVDMPPGTGDVPLTVFQSLPVNGIIIVTSPQELVSMIVKKAVKMAELMNIPIIGIVENLSYFECPNCNERHQIYGDSHIDEIAKEHGIKNLAKIPMDSKLAEACDKGNIENFQGDWLDSLLEAIKAY